MGPTKPDPEIQWLCPTWRMPPCPAEAVPEMGGALKFPPSVQASSIWPAGPLDEPAGGRRENSPPSPLHLLYPYLTALRSQIWVPQLACTAASWNSPAHSIASDWEIRHWLPCLSDFQTACPDLISLHSHRRQFPNTFLHIWAMMMDWHPLVSLWTLKLVPEFPQTPTPWMFKYHIKWLAFVHVLCTPSCVA